MEKYTRVIIFTFCVVLSMSTMTWHMRYESHFTKRNPAFKKIRPKLSELDEESQKVIKDVKTRYSRNWQKLEQNYQEISSQLRSKCNGFDNAIMTQSNTPLGSKIIFDASPKSLVVGKDLVKLLQKEHPFQNKTWKTCAVVGNGGILFDSNCGKMIDSADFVFRCNLPPLEEEFVKDVGLKTSLVTANPSILRTVYQSLNERRRPFAVKLQSYRDAMVLLPAFSYNTNTELCFKAAYTIEDFNVSARAVFFNPHYLMKLGKFWQSKGVNSQRLSTGLMIVSLALEVCSNVDVYGFWPYRNHPSELYSLLQHYYDDAPTNLKVHSMPQEFEHLLRLHNEGVLRLHLDVCENDIKQFKPPQMKRQPLEYSRTCPGCKKQIDKVMKTYVTSWKTSEKNSTDFRNQLRNKCNGSNHAIVNKDMYPNGSKIGKIPVTGDLANILPLHSPFFNKIWDTCSVVGNGGILFDSNCGEKIDSADFVFRCNLPPLDDFKKHVGNKSGLVTANRSILRLNPRSNPKPLLRRVSQYGDAMILITLGLYRAPRMKRQPLKSSQICKGCLPIIQDVVRRYNQTWRKEPDTFKEFKQELHAKCNGFDDAIITQVNTPLGKQIKFDGSLKTLLVLPALFNLFPEGHPFGNTTWNKCAVVGNGGILADSNCGQKIDSADFVIRCNLPPIKDEYQSDVGTQTDIVTANPSIILRMYNSLMDSRLPFVEKLRSYGSAKILLPAFSYRANTGLSLRAVHTLKDFNSEARPVFFNPLYLKKLSAFWLSKGIKAQRLSTGLMMVSLALELCQNVTVYGFWPFNSHPFKQYKVTNHYYDDIWPRAGFHEMPDEFEQLLRLHGQGVLKLHLGSCDT
ncbi:uncharacterized protein ACB057_016458 [Neosynchiropus ocellatus]